MSASTRAALFDLDGTLSDNRPGILASIRHALAAMGVADPGEAALAPCLGPPLRESFARLLHTADVPTIETAVARYRERFDAIGWQENAVYPGIEAVLAVLAAGDLRLLVCTAKPARYARRIVTHFGLDRWISAVYGPDLSGALDDKRLLLAHLLSDQRLDPARCTMIGDRDNDVRAGRGNGTRTIGVLWGYGSREELAGADALAQTPEALPALLA